MKFNYKKIHLTTTFIIVFGLLVITLMSSNPFILISILMICMVVIITSGKVETLKNSFLIFIPFGILTLIINCVFVQTGNIILLEIYGRYITLEAFIFGLLMAFKLFTVIYLFIILDVLIDSDNAVSYFSAYVPKATLIMMITIKFIPNMKKRIKSIKEIYAIRGVSYEGKSIKDKVKENIPVLSIILEDSLEKSFDIGEAAYVRGFLSGKRSIYEKKELKKTDYYLICAVITLIISYIIIKALGKDSIDIYDTLLFSQILNGYILIIVIMFGVVLAILMAITKENDYGIYKH